MKPLVAVLGCGPAGLAAAHAATVGGCDVRVFSKRLKSELHGAQYLHHPIPGMTSTAPRIVTMDLVGSAEEYRRRVYGDATVVSVSPDDLPGTHDAWDIRSTYDNLWDAYRGSIQNERVDAQWAEDAVEGGVYSAVLSTIPSPALCSVADHEFASQQVWALGDAVARGETRASAVVSVADEHVLCNGNGAASWYRAARVFGHTTVEWPLDQVAPGEAACVRKPLHTTCDCLPGVTRLGRYGQWKKGVLVHHAYEEALELCLAL